MLGINFFILITLIVTIETIGLSFVKKFHLAIKNGEKYTTAIKYYLVGVLGYAIVCYLLHRIFYYAPLWLTNCVWNGLSVVLVIMVGMTIFREPFHVHDLIASILVIIAILLFEYSNRKDKTTY